MKSVSTLPHPLLPCLTIARAEVCVYVRSVRVAWHSSLSARLFPFTPQVLTSSRCRELREVEKRLRERYGHLVYARALVTEDVPETEETAASTKGEVLLLTALPYPVRPPSCTFMSPERAPLRSIAPMLTLAPPGSAPRCARRAPIRDGGRLRPPGLRCALCGPGHRRRLCVPSRRLSAPRSAATSCGAASFRPRLSLPRYLDCSIAPFVVRCLCLSASRDIACRMPNSADICG